MPARTCPVNGCGRALATTRNGDPWLMCRHHYDRLDNPSRIKLWRAYRAWQRLERQYLKQPLGTRPAALLSARAEAVKAYIEVRDDCIVFAGRSEGLQLELAQ